MGIFFEALHSYLFERLFSWNFPHFENLPQDQNSKNTYSSEMLTKKIISIVHLILIVFVSEMQFSLYWVHSRKHLIVFLKYYNIEKYTESDLK